jgi:small-conductance mechanosensitive channel
VEISFSQLIDKVLNDPVMSKLGAAAVVIILVIVAVRVSQASMGRYIEDNERRYRIRKLITVAGYLVATFLLSLVYSDKFGGLTVFFGVAGAGIAFALQEVIMSVAGWVTLSFGKLYNVGDRIQLAGIKGDVIDISMLRTTLMECGGWIDGDQYNGRMVRIANSFVFKEPVHNYSSDFPFLWDEIAVPIRYGCDYEFVRQSFQQILEDVTGEHALKLKGEWRNMTDQYMLENARLEPMVTLNMKDDWVEFVLRYVVDYKRRRITKDQISVKILELVDSSDKRIVLGSTSFELSAIPSLDIRLKNKA